MEKYSKRQIVEAGRTIIGHHPKPTPELVEAFRVAHTWRELHRRPMQIMRHDLSRRCKAVEGHSLTAGRIKRFQSIRRKLRRIPLSLYQLQDIAGCRAILPNMAAVRTITETYRSQTKYELVREWPHIDTPPASGYRSHHLELRFDGPEEITGGNRLTIELQVRTRLQHAWATAVEAVGMMRDEELKSGQGDPTWLRFFNIMGAMLAAEEDCPRGSSVPADDAGLKAELQSLEAELDAVRTLDSYNRAIRYTEGRTGLRGESFVILYDSITHTVDVRSMNAHRLQSFYELEPGLANTQNVVMVEVDKVGDLREAYPNYFLDVGLFTSRLKAYLPKVAAAKHALSWWFDR